MAKQSYRLPYVAFDERVKEIPLDKGKGCAILLGSALLECYLFSLSLSPRSPWFYEVDSPIFELIGKAWADGRIPYVSYWDQKGPYLFLMNALGYMIQGHFGVFILEALSLFITQLYCWRILRHAYSPVASTALASVSVALFPFSWNAGNTAVAWCLPSLCASFCGLYEYYRSGCGMHSWRNAFVYGVALGTCLMTRATNAIPLCLFVCTTIFVLAKNKFWRNLLHNLLWGTIGVLCVILPFSLYFSLHGAFDEMWYGTFWFNAGYFGRGVLAGDLVGNLWAEVLLCPTMLMLVVLLFQKVRHGERRAMYLLLPTLASCAFYLCGNGYKHYFLVFLPLTYIFFAELRNWQSDAVMFALSVAQMTLSICSSAFVILFGSVGGSVENVVTLPIAYDALMEEVPMDCRDSFLMVDAEAQGIYLKYDIYPYNRFFSLQSWHASFSDSLRAEMVSEFSAHEPDYVMVETKGDRACVFQTVLDDDYEVMDETTSPAGVVTLFRRRASLIDE